MTEPRISISVFDNFAGIAQVWGTIGPSNWFFHARGGNWQFHLVEQPGRFADCCEPNDDDYWEDGLYEAIPQFTNDQVSAMVDASLRRYREIRGK